MGDRPHPADYMTDAQYEQFRRDGGVSDVSMEVGILNYSKQPEGELVIEHHSGAPEDLSDRVVEVAMDQWDLPREGALEYLDDRLDGGDWVTLVDGEIVETGEFHPHTVDVRVS